MTRDDEAARYRHAAYLALEQLNWCVEYFRWIRKPRIAEQLARTRSEIGSRLVPRAPGSTSDGSGVPQD